MIDISVLKDNIIEGYAYHKAVWKERKMVDFIFLDINDKFTQFTGLGEEILNKKATVVLSGIENSYYNWIDCFSEIAEKGGEKFVSAYSEPLKKWYKIKVFTDRPGYFITLFQDISDYEEKKLLDKILNYTIQCQQLSVENLNYDFFTDSIKELTGASYVALNIVSQADHSVTITKSVSGVSEKVRKFLKKFNFEPEESKWNTNHESFRDQNKLVPVDDFIVSGFLSDNPLLEKILKELHKFSSLGDLYNMEMTSQGEILGSISIIMPKGVSLKHREIIELYINQVSATLKRLQVEKMLIEKINENEKMFNGAQTAMFLIQVIDRSKFIYLKNNKFHQEATGLTEEYIAGKTPVELLGKELGSEVIKNYQKCVQKAESISYEEILNLPAGEKIWNTTLTPIIGGDGSVTHVVGSSQDVTEYKKANENLEESRNLLNRLIEDSPIGIFQVNSQGQYIDANFMGCHILGYEKEEILNMSILDLLDESYTNESNEHFKQVKETGYAHSVLLMKNKIGKKLWIDLSASKINEDRYIGYFRDITDKKETEDKVRYLSFHDTLTGLYNRAYFEEEFKRLDVNRQHPISLIVADIDDLKTINDIYGHTEGDDLIIAAANIFRELCRKEDIIVRWGGDEFVILLPQTDRHSAELIAERVKNSPIKTENNQLNLSVGVATKVSTEQTQEQVFKAADQNMYRHKQKKKES